MVSGTSAQFNHPYAVAVDNAGNVYVSDSANNAIRKITPGGVVSTLAGLPGYAGNTDGNGADARFWNPQGLAVDTREIFMWRTQATTPSEKSRQQER